MCAELGALPLCTCNSCGGTKTHEGDHLGEVLNGESPAKTTTTAMKGVKRPLVGRDNRAPSKWVKEEVKKERVEKEGDLETLSMKKLTATECVLCPKHVNPKSVPVPLIHIGKYRTFEVHKKQHLTDSNDLARLHDFITRELEHVRQSGDQPPVISLEESSQEKEGELLACDEICSGFTQLNPDRRCIDSTDAMLWIERGERKLFFCKATHLTRFLAKERQRKEKEKRKRKRKKRKRRRKRKKEQRIVSNFNS
jgi:hypothetical protein